MPAVAIRTGTVGQISSRLIAPLTESTWKDPDHSSSFQTAPTPHRIFSSLM